MSHTHSPAAAPTARQARRIAKQFTARLTGRTRGPDPEVHRNSYDVDAPEAKPWARIGDGSVAQGLAHREALLQTTDDLYRQQWKEMPIAETRVARDERAAAVAELRQHLDAGAAPIGRPAVLRQEIARLDAMLDGAERRLRRIDRDVLKAIIGKIDFSTGKLFPALDTIAEAAGCHRNSVIRALRRLKANGLIDWVRRSLKTGKDGEFAPQREQTSNAYFFDHRRRMAPRTWQRFWQLFIAKLRRLGATPAQVRPAPPSAPPTADVSGLRLAIAQLGASVSNAST